MYIKKILKLLLFTGLLAFSLYKPANINAALTCTGTGSYTRKSYDCTYLGECSEHNKDFTLSCGDKPAEPRCNPESNCGYCRSFDQYCIPHSPTYGECDIQIETGVEDHCGPSGSYWQTSGCSCVSGGGPTPTSGPTPTPGPDCNCGNQNCDYSISGCECINEGCKVGGVADGANCYNKICGSTSYSPKGYHDSSYCDYSYGWTCDQDSYSTPLTVNFYKDGPPGTGTFIGSILANVSAEAGVASQCGGYANHRFNFPMPASIRDNLNHTIYAQAVNIGSGSDILLTGTPKTINCPPLCNLTYPTNVNLTNQNPTSSVLNWSLPTVVGTSQRVRVGSSATAVADGCPSGTGPGTGCVVKATLGTTETSYNVTGLTPDTVYYYRVINHLNTDCRKDVTISAKTGFAPTWWQVKDADVITNGNLTVTVPTTATSPYFNLAGNGGFPGVNIYGGTTNLTGTTASVKKWLANTTTLNDTYDSGYFFNAVPGSVTVNPVDTGFDSTDIANGTASDDGYKWFKYDTTDNIDLNVETLSLGTNKVILMVKGANVNLKGKINRTLGQGFLLLVTDKNIIVDPAVGGGTTASPDLEGIFVADGGFSTGIGATNLWVKGSVVTYGNATLGRNLGAGNGTTSPHMFEYAPDLEFLFPTSLTKHSSIWREVAP